MIEEIRVLLLEDSLTDAELISHQIEKVVKEPDIKHLTSFLEFQNSLNVFKPDVVLCDYNLNGFNGLDVLEYVLTHFKDIPFLFVTGTVNDEELAANTILSGASGFILKKDVSKMHLKLLPYFQSIVEKRDKTRADQDTYDDLVNYLQGVMKTNQLYKDSCQEIRKILASNRRFLK